MCEYARRKSLLHLRPDVILAYPSSDWHPVLCASNLRTLVVTPASLPSAPQALELPYLSVLSIYPVFPQPEITDLAPLVRYFLQRAPSLQSICLHARTAAPAELLPLLHEAMHKGVKRVTLPRVILDADFIKYGWLEIEIKH